MSSDDNATGVSWALMVILGIPCLIIIGPAILQGFAGDWTAGRALVDQDIHWIGLLVGALICLVLTVGRLIGGED